jgi:hypothetical protein
MAFKTALQPKKKTIFVIFNAAGVNNIINKTNDMKKPNEYTIKIFNLIIIKFNKIKYPKIEKKLKLTIASNFKFL